MTARLVWHTPEWEPAELPIDAEGNTRPGYVCVHQLENGNGQCGGNVFDLADAIGDHCCMVSEGWRSWYLRALSSLYVEQRTRRVRRMDTDWSDPYQIGWCGQCGEEIRRGDKGVPWIDERGDRICRDGYPHRP